MLDYNSTLTNISYHIPVFYVSGIVDQMLITD